MLAALDHRGADGRRLLARSTVVLGHQHFWTTPEEVGERQPLSDAGARVDVVFDGRLDNRAELLAALGELDPTISDAALALRAFATWGEPCFERFLGAFAAAFWDSARRRLVLARDPLGSRTLCYRITPRLVLVASEEAALLVHPDVGTSLNDATLAEFFAVSAPRDGSTFFRDISELLPAHVLVVTEQGTATRRFWRPEPARRVEYRTDREYADHFRELLADSVRCRLRCVGRPAVMMSGGMDSPAIAALAATELDRRDAGPLATFSWVFDELRECDERRWILPTVDRFRLDATYVTGDTSWPLRDAERWPVDPSRPWSNAYRLLKQQVYAAARSRGCRVLLNGAFSDAFYTGSEEWLTDLVREGRLRDAAKEIRRVARGGARAVVTDAGVRRLVRRALLGGAPDFQMDPRSLPWLTPYAQRLLAPRVEWHHEASLFRRPEQYESVLGPFTGLDAAEMHHASRSGVEVRDPFRDRRLVELALAVPAHQLLGGGRSKRMHRAALSDLLPAEVTARTQPTGLTPLFSRGLDRERETARRLLSRKDAPWRRFVSAASVAELFSRRNELPDGAASLVPWQCLSSQIWIDRASLHTRAVWAVTEALVA
jgi:asparagine synthase (glutamine-hydrolysing)